ncbi:hypothetical protein V6N12_063972 [Hibiscus sabdariffa]|uniref:ATP-grasp fold succinyl-CoA synthetase-type domain-containing protein n=1 Tax=Hibiscus sabdariffa TaxID=183260 RepID=A0ABR2APR5_9ROSI
MKDESLESSVSLHDTAKVTKAFYPLPVALPLVAKASTVVDVIASTAAKFSLHDIFRKVGIIEAIRNYFIENVVDLVTRIVIKNALIVDVDDPYNFRLLLMGKVEHIQMLHKTGLLVVHNPNEGTLVIGLPLNVLTTPSQVDLGKIVGQILVIRQIGSRSKVVSKVYLCEKLSYVNEMYFAISLDCNTAGPLIIACSKGGTNVENLAEKFPNMIFIVPIDVFKVITIEDAAKVVDCLATKIFSLCDPSQEDSQEITAVKVDVNCINCDGEIGCMVNGAELAMKVRNSGNREVYSDPIDMESKQVSRDGEAIADAAVQGATYASKVRGSCDEVLKNCHF